MNIDLSKASGPDCIPVVVLKNCDPELSYILDELFNKYPCISLFPVFKNIGKGLQQLKTTTLLVFFLRLVKFLKKLVSNRIVDQLEKRNLFSDFQYGCRSSQSTADLLTVVSDRIATTFNRSGALDITKAFEKIWHASLLHKLKSYGISCQIFGLISSFLSNRQFWVVLDGLQKNIQLMVEFLKAPSLVPHFCYIH